MDNKSKVFCTQSEETIMVTITQKVEVEIGEDGRIIKVSVITDDDYLGLPGGVEGDPHKKNVDTIFDSVAAFRLMMDMDMKVYKDMLETIKETDPEMYEYGCQIMADYKAELIKGIEERYTM